MSPCQAPDYLELVASIEGRKRLLRDFLILSFVAPVGKEFFASSSSLRIKVAAATFETDLTKTVPNLLRHLVGSDEQAEIELLLDLLRVGESRTEVVDALWKGYSTMSPFARGFPRSGCAMETDGRRGDLDAIKGSRGLQQGSFFSLLRRRLFSFC